MKKLSTLAALAGALTMTVATVAHAEPKSSSTDKLQHLVWVINV